MQKLYPKGLIANMEPLKSLQTRDYIVDMLREDIFSGVLADGDELTQELLAERLGVSRMPVREALHQLALEGRLERLPNRHMRVVGVTPRRTKQNFYMLATVEVEIVSILIREQLPLNPVEKALEQYQMATDQLDPEKYALLESGIHESLGVCLQNPFLYTMHQRLLKGYFVYALQDLLLRNPEHRRTTLDLFEELLRQIKQPDIYGAAHSLNHYFREVTRAALTTIGGNPIVKSETH